MRHIHASRLILLGVVVLSMAASFACSPQAGTSRPGDPVVAKSPVPTLEGTVSGGGGNGCSGAAFETYAKKITSLDEYRLYIRPILLRMTEQGSDPLVTYLIWAAEEKAWYFVPCELGRISTEQIGVAVDSDQLARHGEHSIFIHSIELDPAQSRDPGLPPLKTYAQKKLKERAVLLLHEMVMGARLLMKKTAREQCTALAKKNSNLCLESNVTNSAELKSIDPKEAMIMDNLDHDAVRTMTSLLAQKDADLSSGTIRAARERLGFNFPWGRALSSVGLTELVDAVNRSRLLKDRYSVAKEHRSHFKGEDIACSIQFPEYSEEDWLAMGVRFHLSYRDDNPDILKIMERLGIGAYSTLCADFVGRVYDPNDYISPKHSFARKCESGRANLGWAGYGLWIGVSPSTLVARGVLIDGIAYDEVKLELRHGIQFGSTPVPVAIVRIYLTRESAPRLHSIRIEPKQILKRTSSNPAIGAAAGDPSKAKDELLDIPGVSPLTCVREPAQ